MAKKPLSFYEVFKAPDDSSENEESASREGRSESEAEEVEQKSTPASAPAEPSTDAPPEPEYAEVEPVQPPAPEKREEPRPQPQPSAPSPPAKPEPKKTAKEDTSQSMPFPSGETSSNKRFLTIGVDTAIILSLIIFFLLVISYRVGHKDGYSARSAELTRMEENDRINNVQAKPLDEMADIKDLVRDRKANPVEIPGKEQNRSQAVKRNRTAKIDSRFKYTIRIVWTSKKKARKIINELKKKKFDAFTDRSGKAVYVGKFKTIKEERAVEMLHYFKRLQQGNARPYKTAYFVPLPKSIVD